MLYQLLAGNVVVALQAAFILELQHLFSQQNKRLKNSDPESCTGARTVEALEKYTKSHFALFKALDLANQTFKVGL